MTDKQGLNEVQTSVARKAWETPAYDTLPAQSAENTAAVGGDGGGSS